MNNQVILNCPREKQISAHCGFHWWNVNEIAENWKKKWKRRRWWKKRTDQKEEGCGWIEEATCWMALAAGRLTRFQVHPVMDGTDGQRCRLSSSLPAEEEPLTTVDWAIIGPSSQWFDSIQSRNNHLSANWDELATRISWSISWLTRWISGSVQVVAN